MVMTQRLDIRQSQSLIMTPQLQQAIKLLQMSNQELGEFVAQEVEQNPLLEADDAGNDITGDTPVSESVPTSDGPPVVADHDADPIPLSGEQQEIIQPADGGDANSDVWGSDGYT